MKKLGILTGILLLQNVFAQQEKCNLQKLESNIYKVNAEDLKCLAKKLREKEYYIFHICTLVRTLPLPPSEF